MASNTIYQTPPLGSRPPFATDDDHMYDQKNEQTRRLRQPAPEDPNARTSAYNMYDNYMDGSNRDSGIGAIGGGMMDDMDDEDDDPFDDRHRSMQPPPHAQPQKPSPIPLAAPKPGYAAPVAALNLRSPTSPGPIPRQPSPSHPRPLMLVEGMNSPNGPMSPMSPRMPSPGVPSTPHPLPPTITPIRPAFARPQKVQDVKFASQPILRGEKEETLLPKRGEKGDDFWRRFSMVVKQENCAPQKESVWLRKTQNGSTRLTRWVWVIGMVLLIAVIGGVGLGLYISSQNKTHSAPKAIGGSANEKLQNAASSTVVVSGSGGAVSTSFHVSPTRTVARRDDEPLPTDVITIPYVPSSFSDDNVVRAVPPSRHRRMHNLNRTQQY